MQIKKIIGWLHLWLGLVSGLVVIVVSLTGAVLVYEQEARGLTEPYLFSHSERKALLPPSSLVNTIEKETAQKVANITYNGSGKSVSATLSGARMMSEATMVYINPYSGKVLARKDMKKDFFRIVLKGHYYLWLPPKIGQPVVGISTLVFLFLLISGIILWWPRRSRYLKAALTFKRKAGWKRVNYDIHSVLGFYFMLILFILGATGLVFGYKWFAKSVYFVSSGGQKMTEIKKTVLPHRAMPAIRKYSSIDVAWQSVMKRIVYTPATSVALYIPKHKADPVTVYYNPDTYTRYKKETWYFNPLDGKRMDSKEARPNAGDRIKKMNYDIHIGAIGGAAGKLLAFLTCLLSASLPVTGFLIYLNRKKPKKNRFC